MTLPCITSQADLDAAARALVDADPRFAPVLARIGPLPLRLRPDGFGALLDAIVSQQVSTASAAAIHARLTAAGLTNPAAIARGGETALRACGLSRPKIRYALALAAADVDYPALHHATDADLIATLTALPGIGRWSAEIYACFALGRPDILPAGDLALQEAARVLFDLPERPAEKPFRAMAEVWAPWRAVAARALWAYYRIIKDREGIR